MQMGAIEPLQHGPLRAVSETAIRYYFYFRL